jgi:Ca2+-binding EF-hand superfamily protein
MTYHAMPYCAVCCAVLCAGERLHVLDLDNDGLITEKELSDALQFLKANLDDEDLKALLEK